MPRPCTICQTADRDAIDLALASGEPVRQVASKWSASRSSVARHFESHLRPGMARVQTVVRDQVVQEVARGDGVLEQVRQRMAKVERLAGIAEGLIGKAASTGDWRGATAAVGASVSASREVRSCLELVAKLLGELDERPQINVLVAPEWIRVRTALLDALRPFPEARQAVLGRLTALEAAA